MMAERSLGQIAVDSQRAVADANIAANRSALRDQFAMAALTGQLANPNFDTEASGEDLGRSCYTIADAMLAAREAG